MRKFYFLLLGILFLNLVSAVPQIFSTDFNVTINSTQAGNVTTGTLNIVGEGGILSQNFPVQGICNFSYSINRVPWVFSREIVQNDTDVAVLIRALTISNNVTKDYLECRNNLSWCVLDTGYKQNYTDCSVQLQIQRDNANSYANQLTEKNNQISTQTQQKWIAVGAAVICAVLAWNFSRKSKVKTVKNQFTELPSGKMFQ